MMCERCGEAPVVYELDKAPPGVLDGLCQACELEVVKLLRALVNEQTTKGSCA